MTRKMTVGAAAAAFFGTILAASATSVAGVAWNAETTNDWFTATMNLQSPWDAPDSGEAILDAGTIRFDTEVSDPLKYQPAASGPVALVNVQMVVDPNASMPTTDGLDQAQAALSVVTNTDSVGVHWVGLRSNGNGPCEWVDLTDRAGGPTVGATYDVQIAVDNHGAGRGWIRYAVRPANTSAAYTILTDAGGAEWFSNPQSAATNVTKIAFAGAGTVSGLGGKNIKEKGVVVGSFSDSATGGYDFTNGTITAVVTIPSGDVGGKTANLVVRDTSGAAVANIEGKAISSASGAQVAFDLSGLTPGATYKYELSINYGDDDVRTARSGTFVAANWSDACLFGGVVAGSTENVTNGVMYGAVAADSKWSVLTNALFSVNNTSLGANKVTRVDTSYSFETFIDTDSLERLPEGSVGGIVAVSNGADPAWYAYTGEGATGWEKLTGDIVPATNTDYVVRAEFDFKSATKRVSYAVSTNVGGPFSSLALLNGNVMIGLVGETPPNTLSSVEMSGKGFVKSICANIADPSVAEVNDVKYTSLWEAVKNAGNNPIKLLTNATLAPAGITGGKYQFTTTGGFSFVFDKSGVPGAWKVVKKGGVWYLMKPAATYIFF